MSTVLGAVRNEAWEMSEVVKNKEERIRANGGGTSEGERGSKERQRRVKDVAEDFLPWSSWESACACEKDSKPCRGWRDVRRGGAVKWGLEAERSTEEEEGVGRGWITRTGSWSVWEPLRLLCVPRENEWMMRGLQLHFLLHWRTFNWILLPLRQCFYTGLLLCHQLLYDP